jgi:hypothetical protein
MQASGSHCSLTKKAEPKGARKAPNTSGRADGHRPIVRCRRSPSEALAEAHAVGKSDRLCWGMDGFRVRFGHLRQFTYSSGSGGAAANPGHRALVAIAATGRLGR